MIHPAPRTGILVAAGALSAATLHAQTANTPAELLQMLAQQGIDVSGYVVNPDGTVSQAPPPQPEPADAESAQPPPDEAAPPSAQAPAPTAPPQQTPEPAAEWANKFILGLSASYGNTDNQDLTIGFESTRTSKRTEFRFDASYYYAETDDEEVANEATAGSEIDFFIKDSRWLYFVGGRVEYDEFEDFDVRINFNAGLGYHLIRLGDIQPDIELTLRGGAGFTREFGSDDNTISPEALLGADFAWQLTENQAINAQARVFPDLDDGGEFRARNTLDYSIAIDRASGLAFELGVLHEYDSDVEPETDENDVRVTAALVFEF